MHLQVHLTIGSFVESYTLSKIGLQLIECVTHGERCESKQCWAESVSKYRKHNYGWCVGSHRLRSFAKAFEVGAMSSAQWTR